MTLPDPRARFITAAMRAVQYTTEAVLALVDYAAEKRAPVATVDDPQWGYVSRAQLPAWISADQWADACALGQIEGARKSGRSWVAPRASTLAWALAGARVANDGTVHATPPQHAPPTLDEVLSANGLARESTPATVRR